MPKQTDIKKPGVHASNSSSGPKGFDDLVKLAMKERPAKPKTTEEIWNRFLFIVFMGGKRSEPEINFVIGMLKPKKLLDLDFVQKTDGDDWRDAVNAAINERVPRIKDEDILAMLKDMQKEIFRISASIKGGARFFKKNAITPEKLGNDINTKEKTWEFIEGLVKDEDVSNVRYTKIIIWLHSLGYAPDFVPPSWQTKKFVNDYMGYYQFYEDDAYFMKKAQEFAADVGVKGATPRDVSAAIFYFIALKSMLPQRSFEKKNFTPAALIKFMKAKKYSLAAISEKLGSFDGREELAEEIYRFLGKR